MKNLVFFVVKKYLKYDKTQVFISVTAVLAFLGVLVGVAVLLSTMAIMNGFDKNFQERLFTMNYPITIRNMFSPNISQKTLDDLQKNFPTLKFSPYLRSSALIKSGDFLDGVIVYGVLAKSESDINKVFKTATKNLPLDRFEIIVGKTLKDELYTNNKDKLLLIFTQNSPLGILASPVMKRFNSSKVFDSGLVAYDKAIVYVNLKDLQDILQKPYINGIHVYSKNEHEDLEKIKSFLGDEFSVVGWWQQNGNFFSALALEKKALFLVLMLIILVASLNIITSLLMTVMSRRREIALLLSLGATRKEVQKIFFILGSIIGLAGVVFGVLFGLLGIWVLGNYEVISLPKDVYGMTKIPVDLDIIDFLSVVFGSSLVVLISAYYPSKKASSVDILTVLRNE